MVGRDGDREEEVLSTEIVNRGIVAGPGPYAGSLSFSVRVGRGLPDFLNSVNLKYVKLGYAYLLALPHGFYLILIIPPLLLLLIAFFSAEIGKLITIWDWDWDWDWDRGYPSYFCPIKLLPCDPPLSLHALFLFLPYTLPFLAFTLYVYPRLTPRATYLLDFACYRPPSELKISKDEFIQLARKSGQFDDAAITFQRRALHNSGIGDETYMPRSVFLPATHGIKLKDAREEAAMVMFGAVDDLLTSTKVRPKDIKVLVANCGILNTTPSLASMLINHYKLRHNIQSFNIGGMGCAAGSIATDLAKDLLNAYPGSYALVVSTEVVSYTWYGGNDKDMLLPNCLLRMGAAALLLSSCRLDRWRSKYELTQLVRTHKGMDNRSFKSIHLKEDTEGRQGLSVSKDVIEEGGHALKANITTLGPLVLPLSEQVHFFTNLLFKKKSKPYIPNYKLAFEHVCILATSKKVLDELQKNLDLTDEYMETSRKTLERFGNTSASSAWYQLAYLEANTRIKRGDRIWHITFGSGFKCNSVVWKALRTACTPERSPWLQDPI